MDTGILFLACIIILAVSGALNALFERLSLNKTNIVMFCVVIIVLNAFQVNLLPELSINPGAIAAPLLLMGGAIGRHEYKFMRAALAEFVLSAFLILSVVVFGSGIEWLGLYGFAAPVICGSKRPMLSMFCAAFSTVIAYYASIVLSSAYAGGVYILFDSSLLLNMQVIAVVSSFASSCLALAAQSRKLKRAGG